jgi:ABC-type amino acid transport substrate-binding protein
LFDRDGRRYIDASGGAAVSCLGHAHPDVLAALHKQLDALAYAHTAFFTTEVAFSVTFYAPQFKWIALKSSSLKTTDDLKGEAVVVTQGTNTSQFVARAGPPPRQIPLAGTSNPVLVAHRGPRQSVGNIDLP